MKAYKTSQTSGFFDVELRVQWLLAKGNPLSRLDAVIDWESFRPLLEAALDKPAHVGQGQAEEFNSDILLDPTRSLLVPYIGKNAAIFKCPAEKRSGKSTAPSTKGQRVPAARTFSMSQAVGTDPYAPSRGQLAVNGPWLDGNHNHTRSGPWNTYGKLSDMISPAPSDLWVLLDEDYRSLNDAGFAVTMVSSLFLDAPGTYHNMACGFAFGDGHSEIHKWKDGRTQITGNSFLATSFNPINQDVTWIQERTSAQK